MQSRGMSALEALANAAAGWLIALMAQMVLRPVIGLQATLSQNLIPSGVFTVLSLLRSYAQRRVFDGFGQGRGA